MLVTMLVRGQLPESGRGKASLKATVVGQREAGGQEPASQSLSFSPVKVSAATCLWAFWFLVLFFCSKAWSQYEPFANLKALIRRGRSSFYSCYPPTLRPYRHAKAIQRPGIPYPTVAISPHMCSRLDVGQPVGPG